MIRVDLRDDLRLLNAALRRSEQTSVAMISDVLVDQQGEEWSRPVQMRFVRRDDGLLEIVCRDVEEQS